MTSQKPKIEVVQLGLDNFDIEKEILEKADKIIVDTNRLANLQPVSKKKRDAAQWEEKVKKAAELLISAVSEKRKIPATELIAAVEISPRQLGGFIIRVQNYLRADDDWTLQKVKIKSKGHYFVVPFSGESA